MRDPIMRAFSEFSMFTTWGWDKEKSFVKRTTGQMEAFTKCNTTLAEHPELLTSLPDEELFGYSRSASVGWPWSM